MPRLSRTAIGLALCLAAACAGFAWFFPARQAPHHGAANEPSADVTDHPAARAGAERRKVGQPPLPPGLDSLRERADSGDTRAACQLSGHLLYCGEVLAATDEATLAALRQMESEAVAAGKLEEANQLAHQLLDKLESRRRCDGMSRDAVRSASHYLRQAALAGERDAMLIYALGDGLAPWPGDGQSYLREPEFERWRAEAPDLLQALLEAGDVDALMARTPLPSMPLNWILPPDPERDLALSMLMALLFDRPKADFVALEAMAALDPAQRAAAGRRAAQWHRAYFGGRRLDLAAYSPRVVRPWAGANGFPEPTAHPSLCAGGTTR